ncbi:hypothetical protein CHS0354_036703 [Potamilus streckersoni]|uniref:Uncharacterized protein n=1 Tax=Potamilus streckersoni TaxID=2493646 RepID=A0AAE0S2M2_9BIVA|nr:hypothetical protein CHS0354_036703 [Potamilus streckersoni]
MLLEMTYVKIKLEQSERRISELEAIVFNMRFDEYSDNMMVPLENDAVDKPNNESVTKFTKEEEQNCSIPELKKTSSNEPEPTLLRRILEQEAIVDNVRFDEYSGNLSPAVENDTVDTQTNETVTKFIEEE